MLQAVAVLERLAADSGDRVGDGYACQAATTIVSVTYCISINLD